MSRRRRFTVPLVALAGIAALATIAHARAQIPPTPSLSQTCAGSVTIPPAGVQTDAFCANRARQLVDGVTPDMVANADAYAACLGQQGGTSMLPAVVSDGLSITFIFPSGFDPAAAGYLNAANYCQINSPTAPSLGHIVTPPN